MGETYYPQIGHRVGCNYNRPYYSELGSGYTRTPCTGTIVDIIYKHGYAPCGQHATAYALELPDGRREIATADQVFERLFDTLPIE